MNKHLLKKTYIEVNNQRYLINSSALFLEE